MARGREATLCGRGPVPLVPLPAPPTASGLANGRADHHRIIHTSPSRLGRRHANGEFPAPSAPRLREALVKPQRVTNASKQVGILRPRLGVGLGAKEIEEQLTGTSACLSSPALNGHHFSRIYPSYVHTRDTAAVMALPLSV